MRLLNKNKLYIGYAALLLVFSASLVLTNISYDAEYQMAMAYRLIKGDALITQMWEPHQTSAFLCAIFMQLYMWITGTTTGIVLYIQVVGLFIRAGISLLIYRAVKEVSGGTKQAEIAALLYFIISPKDLLTPEFGNMQLWFTTLMFLALLEYLRKEQAVYLILGGVSLCLAVFSYPSAIICYGAACLILWKYSSEKWRDIAIFTAVCAVIGGTFAGYLVCTIGLEVILKCVSNALALEPSHTVNIWQKTFTHLKDIGFAVALLLIVLVMGFVAEQGYSLVRKAKTKQTIKLSKERWLITSGWIIQIFFLWNILSVEYRNGMRLILFFVLLMGFWKRSTLQEKERIFYDSAIYVSVAGLLATLLLSDNAFLPAVPYMLIAVCASVLPIYHWVKDAVTKAQMKKSFVLLMHVFFILIIFRGVFIHIPMYGRGQINSILDDHALIRKGPAIGIIADEAGAARQRDSMAEWEKYIKPGDTIWILGEPVDTLGYLYEDVEVGAPTVMSTPTYNEKLLYYWELNPEKYPDVVILASGFGELSWELSQNSWLLNWIEEEYQPKTVIDGNYWRYHFREIRE